MSAGLNAPYRCCRFPRREKCIRTCVYKERVPGFFGVCKNVFVCVDKVRELSSRLRTRAWVFSDVYDLVKRLTLSLLAKAAPSTPKAVGLFVLVG